MQITLLCVSKPVRGWAEAACQEYEKRLRGMLNFAVKEIPPIALSKNQSKNGLSQNKDKEAQALLNATPKQSTMFALDENGTHFRTREFADRLEALKLEGRDITFYIGGADGLGERILNQCQQRIALSKMTMPHLIARIVFTEQLYRVASLLNNHPYHRDGS